MKKETNIPIATQIRRLEVGEHIDLPRKKVAAINGAVFYQTASLGRKFTRILTEDKKFYRVTRTE